MLKSFSKGSHSSYWMTPMFLILVFKTLHNPVICPHLPSLALLPEPYSATLQLPHTIHTFVTLYTAVSYLWPLANGGLCAWNAFAIHTHEKNSQWARTSFLSSRCPSLDLQQTFIEHLLCSRHCKRYSNPHSSPSISSFLLSSSPYSLVPSPSVPELFFHWEDRKSQG